MSNDSLWPDLDKDESTKCIYEFIKTLREDLKNRFEGKIDCSFDEIEYKSLGLNGFHETLAGLKNVMSPVQERSFVEKGKEEVRVSPPTERKFVLYNDKYFFRVFDVRLGAYFPVEIKPAEGIVKKQEYDYEEVESSSDFNCRVLSYLNSKYIKDVIRYMISLK